MQSENHDLKVYEKPYVKIATNILDTFSSLPLFQ